MRSSRLLTMLLLLQTRQRMTTAELAERLEVSRRTVLRDVDALSGSGVPVYAERGRHGGIVLLPGARLNVSHLDPDEREVLAVAGLDPGQLERLGLGAAHEMATRKMAARGPHTTSPAAGAVPLSELIVVDNTSWMEHADLAVDVADLAVVLRGGTRLRIRYRRSGARRATDRVIDPYGLAAKSGRWYLVADDRGSPRLFSLHRMQSFERLDEPVVHRHGQSLRSVWSDLQQRTESAGSVVITARLRSSRVDLARRVLGARLDEVTPGTHDWCTITVRYTELEAVRQLLQFGDHLEVLAPPEARARVHDLASDLAARHAPQDPRQVG